MKNYRLHNKFRSIVSVVLMIPAILIFGDARPQSKSKIAEYPPAKIIPSHRYVDIGCWAWSGGVDGCTTAGILAPEAMDLPLGEDAPRDVNQYVEKWRKRCDQNDQKGCALLGTAYIMGLDFLSQDFSISKSDSDKARRLLSTSCEKGILAACHNLAWVYKDGIGVSKDHPKAAALLEPACSAGIEESCHALAMLLHDTEFPALRDDKRAAGIWLQLCHETDDLFYCVNAENIFGISHSSGKTIRDLAAAHYRSGCESGNADACADMARSQNRAARSDEERQKAFRTMVKACTTNPYTPACAEFTRTVADELLDQCLEGGKEACGKYNNLISTAMEFVSQTKR